jgi:hypothetical protein
MIEELRDLTEAELIRRYDEVVDHANRITRMGAKTPFLSYAEPYINELLRRETVRQGERMEALTCSLNLLTWAIAIATVIGVALTARTLLLGA